MIATSPQPSPSATQPQPSNHPWSICFQKSRTTTVWRASWFIWIYSKFRVNRIDLGVLGKPSAKTGSSSPERWPLALLSSHSPLAWLSPLALRKLLGPVQNPTSPLLLSDFLNTQILRLILILWGCSAVSSWNRCQFPCISWWWDGLWKGWCAISCLLQKEFCPSRWRAGPTACVST